MWILGWIVVAALFAWSLAPARSGPDRPRAGSTLERLLGPIASLASSAQWVRVDLALRRGDEARAYAMAETALGIDPSEAGGWIFLAHHLFYERGSLLRAPDAAERALWIHAGLDTLDRGVRVSRDPGAILFERGVDLAFLGCLADEDRAWPASREEAWRLAADAFDRAAAHGHLRAAEAARLAREHATVWRSEPRSVR
ncbi:MAG TPA: hypothetical protein VKF32_15200 [Thermoanaerobaculia bacterium]|nr:hypothetical protein [Thermoanaerobaculia bacterium]